jgi:digeranylgeranylglycerophospholipid reductase
VEVPFELDDTDRVELHLGVAPGLFAWIIPVCKNSARIGLCCREHACEYLRSFLRSKEVEPRLNGKPVAIVAGGLPLGPSRLTAVRGLLAVGDSAGQVKPTSGGGIYPGLVCAKIAGKVAAKAAIEGDVSSRRLSIYDREWRHAIGRELSIGLRLNRMIESLAPEEIDYIVEYISRRDDLYRMIEDFGDIDRPSLLLARMLPAIGFDGFKVAGILRRALWG